MVILMVNLIIKAKKIGFKLILIIEFNRLYREKQQKKLIF